MTRDEQLIKAALDMAAEVAGSQMAPITGTPYAAGGRIFAAVIRAIDPAEVLAKVGAGPATAVRALEWENVYEGVWKVKDPTGGSYKVMAVCAGLASADHTMRGYGRTVGNNFGNCDAAKAAVQADYERRILSALTVQPTPDAVSRLVGDWRDGLFEDSADEAAQFAIEEQGEQLDATPVIGAWLIALAACKGGAR